MERLKPKYQVFKETGRVNCDRHGDHSEWSLYGSSAGERQRIHCLRCARENTKAYKAGWGEKEKQRKRDLEKAYRRRDFVKTKFRSAKKSAAHRDLSFDLTLELVKDRLKEQNFCCALSGVPFASDFSNLSIDRIDSSIGYLPNNIQLVLTDLNIMKLNHPQNYFIELCRIVVKHHGPK
jgi:hypothetical protein